jgi:hypothetical protein
MYICQMKTKKKDDKLRLTGRGDKEKRRELDFYPTPSDVTVALMDFLMLDKSIIWEPACGNGAMSKVMEHYGHEVISTELRKVGGYGMGGVDFLSLVNYNAEVIVTNPPFALAEQFIEKAVGLMESSDVKVVAMLLKSQYWHAQGRYKLYNKYKPAYVLPLTWRPDFLEHERKLGDKKGSPTMEVAWTVWMKNDQGMKYVPLQKPMNKIQW